MPDDTVPASTAEPPHAEAIALLSLAEVLTMLRGKVGRNWLLAHLSKTPEHDGGPTHRRIGRKIIFAPGDLQRLLASFPTAPPRVAWGSMPAPPSAEKVYQRVLERLASPSPKAKRRR